MVAGAKHYDSWQLRRRRGRGNVRRRRWERKRGNVPRHRGRGNVRGNVRRSQTALVSEICAIAPMAKKIMHRHGRVIVDVTECVSK